MPLPHGRTLYIELAPSMARLDRDGSTLITPQGVRHLDKIRALATRGTTSRKR